MKYFGCVFLFLGLSLFSREYLQKRRQRGKIYSELLAFLLHFERALSHSVCSASKAILDFESEVLSDCGFLPAIKEGKSIPKAVESVFLFYPLSKEEKKRIVDIFGGLTSSEYRDICKRVTAAREEMSRVASAEEEELSRTSKIVPTLASAIAAGFAILVI